MNIRELRIGTKLDLELINSLGEKIGQTYISQFIDVIDKENITIAAPIHEARLMLITVGTKVRIVFLHDKNGLLSFRGAITGKEKRENVIVLYVRIESDFERIQRRKYFRLDSILTATYRVCSENESKEAPSNQDHKKTLTRNVSGSGACIATEEEIPKGTAIELFIWLNKDTSIKTLCKVLRCSIIEDLRYKKYEVGVYFTQISGRDQDALVKYIFDQQRKLLKNNILDKQ